MSPSSASLITFLASVPVLHPELKVISTAESGIVLPLYLLQNIREGKCFLPVYWLGTYDSNKLLNCAVLN